MVAMDYGRDPESVLREWGAHWQARLSGSPREVLRREPVIHLSEGENKAKEEALKVLHPRLTRDEAEELLKYAPMPRSQRVGGVTLGMPDIERVVSEACQLAGESMWDRFRSEELGAVEGDLPHSEWQGKTQAILGVRFLLRQVYVLKVGVRSPNYPQSAFDWVYPYSQKPGDRKANGREATIRLVKSWL